MKLFNVTAQQTAKVLIIKTFISGLSDILSIQSSFIKKGFNKDDILYYSLFDKKMESIGVGELRLKMLELADFLKVHGNINLIVDEVGYLDNKSKYVGHCIFGKVFGKEVSLWKTNGILMGNVDDLSIKFICGLNRLASVKREMESKKIIDSEFVVKEENCNIKVVTDIDTLKTTFRELSKSSTIYFDTEASGLKPFNKDFKLYTLQFTGDLDKNTSYIFFYDHPKKPMTEEYKSNVAKGVKWIIEDYNKKVWVHNFSYDGMVLNSVFGIDMYKVNIYCSLIIYHFLTNSYKTVPLGLKDICFTNGIFMDWDSELDKIKKEICQRDKLTLDEFKYEYFDLDDLIQYAGYDTICLAHLVDKLYDMSKNHPALDVIVETWEKHWQKIMQSLYKVMINGLPFNMEEAIKLKDYNESRVSEIDLEIEKDEHILKVEKILDRDAYKKAMDKYNKKVIEAQEKNKVFKGAKPTPDKEKYDSIILQNKFSSSSTAHKRILFFDVLGMKVEEKTETGQPKVSDDIIQKYAELLPDVKILTLFSEKAKLQKTLSTYILPWIELVSKDRDGRLRSTFNPLNTSGRLRGSNPNLLNITKDSGLKEIIQADYKNGYVVGQIDVNALEERSALLLHKDKVKLLMKETGVEDLHSLGAITISKAKKDGVLEHLDATIPEHLKIVKKEFPHLRQEAKALTFGIAFLCSWRSIAYTYGVSEDIAKEILNEYWSAFQGEWDFINSTVTKFAEQGYGIYHGNVPVLCNEMTNNLDDNDNMSIVRTVYNGVHQSSAYTVLRALDKANRRFEQEGLKDVKLLLSVYDSIIYECHIDNFNYVSNILYEYMSEDFIEDQLFPLAHEVEIGKAYKGEIVISRDLIEQENQIKEFKQKYNIA